MRIKGLSQFSAIGAGLSCGALLLFMIAAVCPVVTDGANAANGYDIALNDASPIPTSVQLTWGTSPSETLDPTSGEGKVITSAATLQLGNSGGYTVYISGNPNLTGQATGKTIPSTTSDKTLSQLENQWGYYGVIGDAVATFDPSHSFKGMSTTQVAIAPEAESTGDVTKKVTVFFGARATGSQTGDTYKNTVTMSVVAQPGKIATFGGITQMQQMTSTICSNAAINDTALLTDTRDNKKYWVTKLLDGNCWMSQNLDLNLSTSTALTSATSDVTSNWTPPRSTTTNVTDGSTTQTGTYSWDLGEYVLNTPMATTACSANNTGLSACSAQGFVNVSGWTASTDPNFYRATSYKGTDGASCTKTANSAVNASASGTCRVYDGHYLVGNYYQWNTATAGTGGTITNANASGSVCPKGWKLPNAGSTPGMSKGTFAYLLQQYGLASAYNSGSLAGTSPVNGNTYNIALSPLFLVRGGYINTNYADKFRSAGQYGYYWSSRAGSDTSNAYYLSFDNSNVYPSGYYNRCLGRSLRCLISTP